MDDQKLPGELMGTSRVRKGDEISAELFGIAAAIVRSDTAELERRRGVHTREMCDQGFNTSLSPAEDPWENEDVYYGAILTLRKLSEIGKTVAPPWSILRKLMRNTGARDILMTIAARPGGMALKSDVLLMAGVTGGDVHRQLESLRSLGILERQAIDRKHAVFTFEITRLGWSVVEVLRLLGLTDSLEPSQDTSL